MKRINRVGCVTLFCALTAYSAISVAAGTSDEAANREAEATRAAQRCYKKLVNCYMKSELTDLKQELRASRKHLRYFSPRQRADVGYIRRTLAEYRPKWWKYTKSSSNTSFEARIWGRTCTVNYVPWRELGSQRAFIRNRRIVVIVSWRPSLVDNPRTVEGELARIHGVTKGDLGEVIVWHELGHNYITKFLPASHVYRLYVDHMLLFHHLQEFYADMTALYHCSPRARLVTMMMRLHELSAKRENEPHTRAAFAVGSLVLSEVLSAPKKLKENWPSIHLPPEVPKEEIELNTIIYMYEHIDPNWTLDEDRALRELARNFIRTEGAKVLRARGTVFLPNKLSLKIMEAQDRELQVKRDAWVARQLEEVIKLGLADKPIKAEDEEVIVVKTTKGETRIIKKKKLRIEIPW